MLSWFEVENFKSIKRLHLDMQPFMVLVGPNGAGKSNVVQALAVMLELLKSETTEALELFGGYDQLVRRRKKAAAWMRFSASKHHPRVDERGQSERSTSFVDVVLKRRATTDMSHVSREEAWLDRNGSRFLHVVRTDDGIDFLTTPENQVLSDYIRTKAEEAHKQGAETLALGDFIGGPAIRRIRLDATALREDSRLGERVYGRDMSPAGGGLPLALERLRPPGKPPTEAFHRVLAGLREVYPRIEDVSTIHYQPGRIAVSFKERGIDAELGEGNVSDGVIHALALLVALETTTDKILVIEEPENALHPWALQRIMERAQEDPPRKEPLILTTHSPVVVDAVKDPASLFIVENDDKRGTIVTPALEKEHALRSILAESGQKLGDVWLGGSLGGVPGAER
ncbi:AAA family ATPase [Polyangium aurulentum]|uniref:AAA family ATPase n=1 Tax=Polyangium aurulentum TaxID=2567896 RepID=UPI0010AE2267|nr:ATP-binding protein [Polyangium aurulentum]UQA63466.1 AAA family ATPase [Polyangium aurulentum]